MSTAAAPRSLRSDAVAGLSGELRVPGDKSTSHRSLMLGALAVGETRVTGLLEGEDVLATAAAMRQLGAEVVREETSSGEALWRVWGRGIGGLTEPADVLDMGNSGTSARLLMGLLATHPMTSMMTGDGSLRRRPMKRVTEPLSRFGAEFWFREGGRLPLAVKGTGEAVPVTYETPVASAQVKSAVLLAGLNAPGETTVIETTATRDHTERMLSHFGATLKVEPHGAVGRVVTLVGQPELRAAPIAVPGDPSSAAFPVVAALITGNSHVILRNIGTNPLRFGLYETLKEMGADIILLNERIEGGEPVADLEVRSTGLTGIDVPAERAASMIDEYPILAMAAACASGTTRMNGLGELRVKESDRLTGVARGLAACGAKVTVEGDDLIVEGTGEPPRGGATIAVDLDHRMAMSFLVLGMVTAEPVAVDDAAAIDTSFPGFVTLMNGLGARLRPTESPA